MATVARDTGDAMFHQQNTPAVFKSSSTPLIKGTLTDRSKREFGKCVGCIWLLCPSRLWWSILPHLATIGCHSLALSIAGAFHWALDLPSVPE